MASSSIGGSGTAAALAARPAPERPHTSMAHSSAAGPGRPANIDRIASATRRGASLRRTDARRQSTSRAMMPAWSRISCRWPKPRPIASCGNLPDQRQHRRIHAIGGEQRRRGIEQARPGHHGIGLRLAGRERGAERHVGGALLVAGVHGAHAVGGLEQRVEQDVVVDARAARRWCRARAR